MAGKVRVLLEELFNAPLYFERRGLRVVGGDPNTWPPTLFVEEIDHEQQMSHSRRVLEPTKRQSD